MEILRALLLEQSIIVLAPSEEKIQLSTSIVNSLMMMVYPMTFVQTVIPILPFELIDILDAPMPYLVSLVEEHWDYYEETQDPMKYHL